ncbi:hypothetical protein [Rhodoblastus sp.]|uniref:hypothetical protein n=1 Tax=Rhodoblastus sp. TaxID=1962975 RepID=UPI003F9C0B8F
MSSQNRGFNPHDAISPRAQWQLVDVLHEGEQWSMAVGKWREPDGWRNVLAQRWNGGEGEKGNPVSHGYPTWFVLPDETYVLYISSAFIPEEKRRFVKDFLGI